MENVTVRTNAVGRRKEAIARVNILPGKGDLIVNGMDCDKYFVRETDKIIVRQPLRATNTLTKYDIVAITNGGGISGQAGALRHAISRAILSLEPETKDILRKSGYLSRDPRMKERKKYGQKGARKRFQWTKR
jgi:small subunit ribosomal protein S9